MGEKLDACWTDDCSGKKDYDGRVISVSTRYWPRGGSAYVNDEKGFRKFDDGSKPSARSEVHIDFAEHTGDGGENWSTVAGKDFEGETFEEVAAQVEAWAQSVYERVVNAVRAEFTEPRP
jgi:hypothetical protein